MPSLKELRNRIRTVKSTEKITSAMKMVAVAKLRRAQEKLEAARPFALGLGQMTVRIAAQNALEEGVALLQPTNKLLILVTSDRGLCGSFNANLLREASRGVEDWKGKYPYSLYLIGQRAMDLRRRTQGESACYEQSFDKQLVDWESAIQFASELQTLIKDREFTHVEVVYQRFQSVLVQHVTRQQLIPYEPLEGLTNTPEDQSNDILEPSGPELLEKITFYNLAAQLYRILLESTTSEHSARLTAMDNASRNANDVINKLQLKYNRTRQALITKELIEVISGAEAL